jgi:diketogulonate reductase-like aldo/keto reductase
VHTTQIPIVKTSSRQRQAENLDVNGFILSDDDMNKIRSLDAGKRVGFDPNLIA